MEDAETYKKMMARDERRFRVADQDGDSVATREELTAFLHPEEFPHMRDIVVAVSESQPPPPVLTLGVPVTWSSPTFPKEPRPQARIRGGRHLSYVPQCPSQCHSKWKDLYLLLPCLTFQITLKM